MKMNLVYAVFAAVLLTACPADLIKDTEWYGTGTARNTIDGKRSESTYDIKKLLFKGDGSAILEIEMTESDMEYSDVGFYYFYKGNYSINTQGDIDARLYLAEFNDNNGNTMTITSPDEVKLELAGIVEMAGGTGEGVSTFTMTVGNGSQTGKGNGFWEIFKR